MNKVKPPPLIEVERWVDEHTPEPKVKPPPMKPKPLSLADEIDFVRQWWPVVSRSAYGVRNAHRLQMGLDDVSQDLTTTIIEFRKQWVKRKGEPDASLVRHAIKWRVRKLNRATRAKIRVAMDGDVYGGDLDLVAGPARVEAHEETLRKLVALLREMAPEQVAMLWECFAEEASHAKVAKAIGCKRSEVSAKLEASAAQAREFLIGLGIRSFEEATEHSL